MISTTQIESNWVEYEGASKVLFTHIDLPYNTWKDVFNHLNVNTTESYIYSDGVDVWGVGYSKDMVSKVYIPRSCIRGHLSPMFIRNGRSNWSGNSPWLSFATVILPNGETRYYMGNQNHSFVKGSMPVDASGHLPAVLNVNEICHTWAVTSDVGWDIVKKITAQGKKKTPAFAVVSARASNIGVAYYNPQSGEVEQDFEPLAQRYSSKYIGRTSSWKTTTQPESIGIEANYVKDAYQNNWQVDRWEFHFPKKHIPKKNEQHNLLGTPNNRLLGGYSAVLNNGIIIRRLWRRDYQKGSPLTDPVPKTRFNTAYEPVAEPTKSWTSIGDLLGGDDMTPKELETVKKWFAGYCNHKARKGEIPSDEELEIAKRLGVYTGN
jgi:hypothetical protein